MASFDYRLNPLYLIKECSSCRALCTTDYCCSEGSHGDNIICDLNKTPDLFQEPSQNCPKCGNSVDEPFVVKQDPDKNSSQSPPQINHHCCYGCGDSLEDIFCHQCTCELCGKCAHYGYNCLPKVPIIPNPKTFNNQTIDELPQTLPSFDPTCYSERGNSFTYDSTSNLVDDSPNVFNPPPQPPLYSCEFCENDALNHPIFNAQNDLFNSQNKLMDQLTSMCDMVGQYIQKKEEEKKIKKEQAAKARYWKIPVCYDDDDDEDYTIAITPKEPDNSLSMGDEHLDTIPATKSDEFIKSSVENLIPNPKTDLSFTPDDPMSPGIKEDDYDFERDILILEELLSNDSLSLPFDISSSSCPPAKPPDGNSGILNIKVMGDISEHKDHEAFQPSTEYPMMIYGRNIPILDVLFLYFYPP
uniref:Uncharacterized protein n=1 Tax=Tanacetum cinerariifolium TaxID=118510 RepID=A0A6L2L8K8_TANCI|nr:hypothetical protein [Tanacetum cinerariifolium]